ncbi:MAG TPA: PAS domain S-box protein [Microbacteriaceae bacterium]|jgi:PAS domain S-box-containing protein|nr:PAS domain S-box protein [Microbacteriaceae bacterium]
MAVDIPTNASADALELAAAAFAHAPSGMAILDFEGTILASNDSFLHICGRAKGDVVGSPFWVNLHPDETVGAAIAFRRFTRGRESGYETNRRYVRPDGSELLVRCLVRADRTSSPTRAIVVIEDVSADGKLLAAISRRDDRFRSMIENANDLITVVDLDGHVLYQSPAVTRTLGWTPAELASWPAFELVHPDDRERCRLAFAQLLWGGTPVTTSYRGRHKDGHWLQIEATGSNLLDDPSVGGIVVNSRDVTDHHRAHEQLRDAERRYRSLVEQLPLVVYATSPSDEGSVVYLSPQVVDLLGYSLEEWQSGRELWERALHPDDRDRVISEIARKRGKSDRIRVEYRMVRADGQTVWLIDEMVLLRDADGRPHVYQGFMIDITERETLHEQLRHAQRLEAIGRLAGGIAHDFNNLLLGITGYSEFAIEANALGQTEKVHQHVSRVTATADRARSLTEQLLAFGRKQMLLEQTIDVGSAITETAELLKRLIGEDIDVVVDVGPAAGAVSVDPAQFEQLLMNLALNARDAMPAGGTLSISAGARAIQGGELADGRYASITVSDTGAGMDKATLQRLFEPFFTTKPKGKGTGLGLAGAHGFVSQSGGEIWVSSTPGAGSAFEILLPQVSVSDGDVERRAERSTATPRGWTGTIIVVEDDEDVRNLVSEMLARHGHKVHAFADPGEALEAAERTKCDAVVSDIVMPKTSGIWLTGEILRRCPRVKVLLMSGHSDTGFDSRVFEKPYVGFIHKPFTSDELITAIDELFAQ